MLEDVTANKNKQALRCKRCCNRARGADGNWKPNDFNLDWVDVLLRGSVRRRRNRDDINGWQPESRGRRIVDTGRGCTGINQSKTSFWSWKCDALRE